MGAQVSSFFSLLSNMYCSSTVTFFQMGVRVLTRSGSNAKMF